MLYLAEWTGLEPATPGVTGRYSNQLNYHSIPEPEDHPEPDENLPLRQDNQSWRPHGDSNPGYRRERAVS